MTLRIVPVSADNAESWREIHNLIIPPHPLTPEDLRDRLTRNHLTLAYAGETLVGNATVRPPRPEAMTATVIVRVLPEHRRRGHGSEYLGAMLTAAGELGARRIETVVLAANADGLEFATRRGFVEFGRYVADGAEYVDLALAAR